jgi:hypothetical protein
MTSSSEILHEEARHKARALVQDFASIRFSRNPYKLSNYNMEYAADSA